MSQTDVLSVWGALTGTIGTIAGLFGLWLQFRQHSLDKAKLFCESSFGFDSPNIPTHKLIIRSLGRRPVTIDSIKYFVIPNDLKNRIIKSWHHKNGRWLWHQEPRQNVKLTEGEKTEIKISLPNGLEITEIYKVEVIDQTGKSWRVLWKSSSQLKSIATQETLDDFTKENDNRIVSASGFRLGDSYFLELKFNTKPGRTGVPCGKGYWFHELTKYQDKLKDIIEKQSEQFLTSEIETIE